MTWLASPAEFKGMFTRQQAFELLHSKMQSENLRKHCYGVEAVMRALARHFSAIGGSSSGRRDDEEVWGIAGLLHDADYEITREKAHTDHVVTVVYWLKEMQVDSRIIDIIFAHGWKFVDSCPEPKNQAEWSLYCCDELTGLITAVALVKGRSLEAVTVEGVLKKFPETKFAAGVDRSQIKLCEDKLGIPLNKFIEIAISAMQSIRQELGL